MGDVAAVVAAACDRRVVDVAAVAGGDICRAWKVRLDDGSVAFAKTFGGDPSLFDAEAQSLAWLAAAGAPVPAVLGVGSEVLVLRWLESATPSAPAAERLGRELAALHGAGADRFGAPWPGYAGRLRLANGPAPSWAEFFAATRLLPLVRRGADTGALRDPALLERVAERLGALTGPDEPPARLHGDLWSGNLLWSTGHAWLVDPAAYGGHRETDLAMLELFGAPHLDRIVTAYTEVTPLADGWRDRIGLHQLYPLLAHAVMFGGGYGARAEAMARRYA
ncbi:MAG TPA: fructosamine kinase family protein [Jatrophihabitantaceae bacterium]|nr:fructosamine kinase family protein [Jatrophihabitantaceae bacterium]